MQWENLSDFGGKYGGHSIGVKGTFPEISREEFQKKLEAYYDHPAQMALGGPEKVSSAALVSGGAHNEIDQAIKAGVDCFITGSFDEPIWHIAFEEKINFFAMGHSNSEIIGPKALGRYLEKKFALKHNFINIHNPF